jgi:hypothetical protein
MMPLVGCSEAAGEGGTGGAAGSGGIGGDGGRGGSAGSGGTGGIDASPYASKDLWLCRRDIEDDQCDMADLSLTEIRADGTRVTSEVAANPDAKVDCFYVYPTTIGGPEPGNAQSLSPTNPIVTALAANAAQFRGVCRVFAPLYHQMNGSTYSTYPSGAWEQTVFFQIAYDDVVEAFEYYMRNHNHGRDVVLLGHSQGSHMLKRLLQDKFDNDEALRGQLLSALLTAPTGTVHVPVGEQVGGSFVNIPLCRSANEIGCVIASDMVAAGVPGRPDTSTPAPVGMVRACVNPASFDSGPGTLAAAMWDRRTAADLFPDAVETEWISYPNLDSAQCSPFTHALEIDLVNDPEDLREVPISPQELQVSRLNSENLHVVESYIVVTDLLRIVDQQVQSLED